MLLLLLDAVSTVALPWDCSSVLLLLVLLLRLLLGGLVLLLVLWLLLLTAIPSIARSCKCSRVLLRRDPGMLLLKRSLGPRLLVHLVQVALVRRLDGILLLWKRRLPLTAELLI